MSELHDPKRCTNCLALAWRVICGDTGLTCVHSGDPCELCLTSAKDRATDWWSDEGRAEVSRATP